MNEWLEILRCAVIGFWIGFILITFFHYLEEYKRDKLYRDTKKHLKHAIDKHPFFCHVLHKKNGIQCDVTLARLREQLRIEKFWDGSDGSAETVLLCEIAEMNSEIINRNWDRAYEECLDCMAVLIRISNEIQSQNEFQKQIEDAKKQIRKDTGEDIH